MLANCRDAWDRDYAHLISRKKMKKKKKKKKKRDAFEEWLYRKKEEDTAGDEFRGILKLALLFLSLRGSIL
jgi:hypothetical protein